VKIAFDWQGTLDVNPILLEMARTLQSAGWEVRIISAMPETMRGVREREIEAANPGLPYEIAYHPTEDYHAAAARAKVALMQSHGIE